MLAITNETAYRICFIKDSSGNCIDSCSEGSIIVTKNEISVELIVMKDNTLEFQKVFVFLIVIALFLF